jgi:glutaredoxin 3
VEDCVFPPAGRKEEDAVNAKRKVEIFSAGCPGCREAFEIVRRLACPSCDVRVLDMNDPGVAARAKARGIRSIPPVAVDGMLRPLLRAAWPRRGCTPAGGRRKPASLKSPARGRHALGGGKGNGGPAMPALRSWSRPNLAAGTGSLRPPSAFPPCCGTIPRTGGRCRHSAS